MRGQQYRKPVMILDVNKPRMRLAELGERSAAGWRRPRRSRRRRAPPAGAEPDGRGARGGKRVAELADRGGCSEGTARPVEPRAAPHPATPPRAPLAGRGSGGSSGSLSSAPTHCGAPPPLPDDAAPELSAEKGAPGVFAEDGRRHPQGEPPQCAVREGPDVDCGAALRPAASPPRAALFAQEHITARPDERLAALAAGAADNAELRRQVAELQEALAAAQLRAHRTAEDLRGQLDVALRANADALRREDDLRDELAALRDSAEQHGGADECRPPLALDADYPHQERAEVGSGSDYQGTDDCFGGGMQAAGDAEWGAESGEEGHLRYGDASELPQHLLNLLIAPGSCSEDDIIIGTGGFAVVNLGTFGGAKVAIKTPQTPEGREFLEAESQVLSRLRHPHIVGFVGLFLHEGTLKLVMEYCAQGSVQGVVSKAAQPASCRGDLQLTWALKAQWLREAALALRMVHQCGYIHRDVTTVNLLLASKRPESPPTEWTIKLADFGTACHADDLLFLRGVLGSAPFIAPEVWRGEGYSEASDVYALGCTAIELLTACVPFHCATWATVQRVVSGGLAGPTLPDVIASAPVPGGLRDLVLQMVSADSQQRPLPDSVISRMENALDTDSVAYAAPAPAESTPAQPVQWGWDGGEDCDAE
eukprot:TRINITY_DN5352_c0_g1_i2.p1 TRINITY_DN5352_c0_g1~~TRINITY_DN5352_c0_g1_i2.p1  ORF type:complete len:683 (+),score=152.02 TRINITY_DN5352_c0_g1_i2:94-2049(+)